MVAVARTKIFRVRGLPHDAASDYLTQAVATQLEDAEKESISFKVLDVVPSCSDQSQVGLLEFKGVVPAFLQALVDDPLAEWGIEYEQNDLFFDSHFYGLTQMYKTRPGDRIKADIIAITGLDGHAFGSWRGRGNLGRMWLRDFLSADVPDCRTMTYGYKLKLSRPNNASLLDYGREFLSDVSGARESKAEAQRPLIFIAHSFGGILLAHALIRASHLYSEPAMSAVYKATYGIVFFGVPHKGLVVEDMCAMVRHYRGEQRADFLEQIDYDSDALFEQANELVDLIQDRRIVTFYETEATHRLVFNDAEQRWERTGPPMTAVTARSATLQLPQSVEDKYPLHADHSSMVKFDSRADKGYDKTLKALYRFEDEAAEVVADRFAPGRKGLAGRVSRDFGHELSALGSHVHRPQLEERLERALETRGGARAAAAPNSQHLVALCGPSGSGKTQLARNLASAHARDYGSVFWVHAKTVGSMENDMRKHCRWMTERWQGASYEPTSFDAVLASFHDWFKRDGGRHLVVFDQANGIDDDGKESTLADMSRFLPKAKLTNVVITTTSQDLRSLPACAKIAVDSMSEDEAVELFFESMETPEARESQRDRATRVVRELEAQPQAVALAGRYVGRTRRLRRHVDGYMDMYSGKRTEIAKRSSIMSANRWDQRTYAAWEVAFEGLRRRNKSAARLVALLGFVCDDEISIDAFKWACKAQDDNPDSDSSSLFDDSSDDDDSSTKSDKASRRKKPFNPFDHTGGKSDDTKTRLKGMFRHLGKQVQEQAKVAYEKTSKVVEEKYREYREGGQDAESSEPGTAKTKQRSSSRPGKQAKGDRAKEHHNNGSGGNSNNNSDDDDDDDGGDSDSDRSSSNADSSDSDSSDGGSSDGDDARGRFPEFHGSRQSGWSSLVSNGGYLEPSGFESRLDTAVAYGLLRKSRARPSTYAANSGAAAWCRQRYRIDSELWMRLGFAALLFLRDASRACPDDHGSLHALARPMVNFWAVFCQAPKVASHVDWPGDGDRYVKALVRLAKHLLLCRLHGAARDVAEYARERAQEHGADEATQQLVREELQNVTLAAAAATAADGGGRGSAQQTMQQQQGLSHRTR